MTYQEGNTPNTASNAVPVDPRWITVASPPDGHMIGNSMVLDDAQFAITVSQQFRRRQIFKYNVHRDEWTVLLNIEESLGSQKLPISRCIDLDARRLYMSGEVSIMMVIDLDSGAVITRLPKVRYIPQNIGVCPSVVNVCGTIHKIGGDFTRDSYPHTIWDGNQEKWIPARGCSTLLTDGLSCCSTVFVPSKNKLFLIGGLYDPGDEFSAGIWSYDIANGIWKKMEGIEFHLFQCDSILTLDEQYILITGTEHITSKHIVDIYVLDIRDDGDYKLMMSLTRKPSRYSTLVARSSNCRESHLLACGWTRKLFATDIFNEVRMPSSSIIRLIAQRCESEMIHWVKREEKHTELAHCKISIDEIMSHSIRTLCTLHDDDCPNKSQCPGCQYFADKSNTT